MLAAAAAATSASTAKASLLPPRPPSPLRQEELGAGGLPGPMPDLNAPLPLGAAPPPTQGPGVLSSRVVHRDFHDAAVSRARAEAFRECLELVRGERYWEEPKDEYKRGYTDGVTDCEKALERAIARLSSEPPVPGETPEPDGEAPRG